jgi:hypothetical protein
VPEAARLLLRIRARRVIPGMGISSCFISFQHGTKQPGEQDDPVCLEASPKKWSAPAGELSRPGLSLAAPTTKTCRRGPQISARGSCKPNSVLCGHSSRRRVAADTHQRPTRRFRHCMEQPFKAPRPARSCLVASGRCAAPALLLGPRFPPYLVLLRVGFTLPPALPPERCALTAPFHPYPSTGHWQARRTEPALQGRPPEGGVAEAVSFLWHWPSASFKAHIPDVIRHTALRSSDFPPPANPSSRSTRRQRPPGPPASS